MWKALALVLTAAVCGFGGGVAATMLYRPRIEISADQILAALDRSTEQALLAAIQKRFPAKDPEAVMLERLGKPPAAR